MIDLGNLTFETKLTDVEERLCRKDEEEEAVAGDVTPEEYDEDGEVLLMVADSNERAPPHAPPPHQYTGTIVGYMEEHCFHCRVAVVIQCTYTAYVYYILSVAVSKERKINFYVQVLCSS